MLKYLPAALAIFATPTFADHGEAEAGQDTALAEVAHLFASAQIVDGPKYVDCTLSEGSQTTCFSITVVGTPTTYTPGPWCPTNVTDGPEDSGKWFTNDGFVDADGPFMTTLADLYNDDTWDMVDAETGAISVTDTAASCAAAARPDVGEEYENYCVQCLIEYIPEELTMTYVIPVEPQQAQRISERLVAGAGVALNGVRLDGPAPIDAILGAYTIAAFDDCGGHVNLNVGYHYHAATDCLLSSSHLSEDAAQIGIAMDGYPIMAHTLIDGSKPTDLGQCGGHTGENGFHYHAGEEGSNAILACLVAQTGCASTDADAQCDGSARRPRP